MDKQQDFAHHTRLTPAYHFGVFPLLFINFSWAVYRLIRDGVHGGTAVGLLLALALLVMFVSVRVQILSVQDRVIRLEMRMRLAQVLPQDLQSQIPSLTVKQMVALRFASDAELPELMRDVLAGKLPTQKDIKLKIRNWQADHQRA